MSNVHCSKIVNMTNYLYKLRNCFWLVSCLCLLLTATTAVAEYKKPDKASSPDADTTTSTATRGGCLNSDNTFLTAIAPYSHVGQTISTHPTFAWFIPDSEYFPLEFHLEEDTGNSQLKTVYKQELTSKPGIMSLTLPQDLPGLSAEKKYRWKVVMRCTRYQAVVTMAEVEVVTSPSQLKTALNNTSGTSRLVDLYAETGLWYDALAMSLTAADFHQEELQNQLIRELAAVETNSNFDFVRRQAEKLTKISDRLKTSQIIEK